VTPDHPTGLVYVVWELTLRCDLACGHCGSRAGKARKDELSTADALRVVTEIAAMGAREVTLIGGEAYLRDDWPVIARAIRDAGMNCTMTTGGRGLDAARAKMAADAGIQGVSVSLDGLEATHDKQRGVRGSFRAALGAIENLRDVGVSISVNTQINRLSVPELEDLFALLIARGVGAWQVQLTVAMGRAADHAEWLLQPYELLDVIPKLASFAARGPEHGLHLWPGNNIGYFGPHEAVLRHQRLDAHGTGCGAGKNTLGIEADGAIMGCPSLPTKDYAGGRAPETPVRDIWEHTRALRFTRDRTVDDLWGYCRTCYYADVCRAGCTWTAHVLFGRAGNNPYCHHRALELAAQGLRERVVPRSAAPGEPFDYGLFDLVVEPSDAGPAPIVSAPRRRLPMA
jgi:radical SAM protein with 4Fe4S-binding SPASM domain